MPGTGKGRRDQFRRRLDTIKVRIEDINLNGAAFPVAQGRSIKDGGLFDIDLSHGVGGSFPTPRVGEIWWIKRTVGSRWILDHKVDPTRTDTDGGGGGGGDNRAGVPDNVVLGFNVREKKTHLEYRAYTTFDAVTVDENGDPDVPMHYIVNWVPCTKQGNIMPDERVKQHLWNANDAEIDDEDDPSNEYYVVLPGNVERPKVWYYKGRVRAVSSDGRKGPWSDWTDPVLPFRVAKPSPPYPDNIEVIYRFREAKHEMDWMAVVKFDDVNYWDIPGFDYEDDISVYIVQLQPLEVDDTLLLGGPPLIQDYLDEVEELPEVGNEGDYYVVDGQLYIYTAGAWDKLEGILGPYDAASPHKADPAPHLMKLADPDGDGEPWPVKRKRVKDKDDDDTYVALGTLDQDISETDTTFNVDETGIDGVPVAPFIVMTPTEEKWLVTERTLVSGSVYEYEVYRQFDDSPFSTHATDVVLQWLKDPYRYKVRFDVERPRKILWRARVRSKDRFNRVGDWSPWTDPLLPWTAIDWNVPPPEDLRADIEIEAYRTHPVLNLVARFKDPAPNGWNLPGGDPQDDLDRYVIVGEALVPDPEGYIDGTPVWREGKRYRKHDVVAYQGGWYESRTAGNLGNIPPESPTQWAITSNGLLFRHPDRKIGVLADQLDPAETSMSVTLDSDLPKSIMDVLDDIENRNVYLRVQTSTGPNPEEANPGEVSNEIVATTEQTSDGTPRVYTIERSQIGSGDYGHNVGDYVYLINTHRRRAIVHDKDEGDPGHFRARYTASLGRVPQPKKFWWRVRGLSIDSYGHRSRWTDWTNPILPSADEDLFAPYPDEVFLSFDKIHRKNGARYRAVVKFSEVSWTAPDGDREADVTRYGIQLATCDGDSIENLIPEPNSEEQLIDFGDIDVGDTFHLTFEGNETEEINHSPDMTSDITTALVNLPNFSPGDLVVTLESATTYRVAFGGIYQYIDVPALSVTTFTGFTPVGVTEDVPASTLTLDFVVNEKRNKQQPAPLPFRVMVDEEVFEVTARVLVTGNQYTYTATRGVSNSSEMEEHLAAAHVFNLPFEHKTMSAKDDDDAGKYNRVAFPRAHKFFWYRARVRTFDRYNRHSLWSPWTMEGSPSDTDLPPEPTDVTIDVDNHKIVTTWDIPVDPNDPDSDDNGKIPGSEVAYCQIQLSDDNFATLMRFDRSVKATSKTWRVKKPGDGTYYVRVRSVDGSGNKSAWVGDSGAMNGVPTPNKPTIKYLAKENRNKLKAIVQTTGVTTIDDDVDGYEFMLQAANFKRLAARINAATTTVTVNSSKGVPNTPFISYVQKERLRVTNVVGTTWTVARGVGTSDPIAHRIRARVQYFRARGHKRRRSTGAETTHPRWLIDTVYAIGDEVRYSTDWYVCIADHTASALNEPPNVSYWEEFDEKVSTIFQRIQKGLWYRARVRARDTKGVYGNWSDWSGRP